jgi:hypothetical protein
MHFNQLVALATLLATAAHGIALPDPDAAADVADIAEEVALLTRNQIIAQASVTMVGQTNLASKNLLDIL